MKVRVYGAGWCPDTKHVIELMDSLGVAYDYIDVDRDHTAADWVKRHNGGKERRPTIDIAGQVLSEPSDHDLESALREKGFMA